MRYIISSLLAVAASLHAAPACGTYKVASFTGVDSVNIVGMIGSFSGGGLGFMRLNAAGTACEFVIPSGTGVPANTHGTEFTGNTVMDTATIGTLLASDTSSFKPEMTADTLNVTDRATFDYATASTDAVFDANKRLVSNAVTGTGNSVRAAGATMSSLKATGTTTTGRVENQHGYGEKFPTAGSEYTDVNSNIRLDAQGWRNANVISSETGVTSGTRDTDGLILGSVYGANTYLQSVIHLRSGPSIRQIELMTGSGSAAPTTKVTVASDGTATFVAPIVAQSTLAVTGASTLTGLLTTVEQKINPTSNSGFNGSNKAIRVNFTGTGDQDISAPIWFGRDASLSGAGIAAYQATADNDRVGLVFFTHPSGVSTDSSVEAGRFSSTGDFLLGTQTVSGNKLHVEGTAYATRFQSGTGTSVLDTLKLDVLDVGDITGAGLFGDSLTVDSALVLANLSANSPLYLDGNNEVKTGSWSGTGTVIPTTQGATMNNLTATGTFTTPTAITMGSNTFTRTGAHNLTLTTGAATNVTLPASGTLYGTASGSITSAQLATSLTNETGSGAAVFGTSPSIATPTFTGTTTAGRIESSDSIVASAFRGAFNVGGQGGIYPYYTNSIRFDMGSANFTGGVSIDGNLTVSGNITGAANFTGNVSFGGGVTVAGPLTTQKSVARKVEYWTAGYSPLTLDETMHYVGHGNPVTGDLVVNLPPLGSGAILGREYVLFVNRFDGSGGDATMTIVADGTNQIWWTSTIPASSISIGSGFSHWAVTLVAGSSHWFVVNASKF